MRPTPVDQNLYDKIKEKVKKENPVHSAYRSGKIVQEYKKAFQRIYGQKKSPYRGRSSSKEGLRRWFAEDWRNQRGEVGYKKKGDVYRPTKRITSKTPITFRELSKEEIRNARKEKKKRGRIRSFSRRKRSR